MTRLRVTLALLLLVGCDEGVGFDLPEDDAATPTDASAPDAGAPPADASPTPDTGPAADAGPSDAGAVDAGADAASPMRPPMTPLDPPPAVALLPDAERLEAHPFTLDGQAAWFHDEGHAAGVFHTFDAFDACGAPRGLHVFLPRDYAERSERYPTLYFHDGHTVFWPDSPSGAGWELGETLSALQAAGRLGPVLAIAVHHGDRDLEYTHEPAYPGRTHGGLEAYATLLAECLVPWVDAHYRTQATPAARALVGSSHGGLATFWTVTRHPEVFGFGGALSPSFWVGLDDLILDRAGATPLRESSLVAPVLDLLADPARRPRLWIDWGLVRAGGVHNGRIEKHATLRGREMVDLLADEGYGASELAWHEAEDGAHDEPSWARRLHAVLQSAGPPAPR